MADRYVSWGPSVYVRHSIKTGIAAEDHFPSSRRLDASSRKPHSMFVKRIYRPDIPQENRRVVLFFPGSWSNGNMFRGTLDGQSYREVDHLESFANIAASRGFDAWIFHGWSPRVWTRYVERYYFRTDFVDPSNISFENTLAQDIPPLLDYVESITGSSKFGWVGHSKGGLLAYAYTGCTKDPRIAAMATMGSPVTFTEEQKTILLMALISFIYFSAGFKEFNPLQIVSEYILPLSRLAPSHPDAFPLLWNPENMSNGQSQFMIKKVSEPLPIHIFYFLVQMVLTRKFMSLPEGGFTKLNWAQIISDFLKYRGPGWLPTLPFFPGGQVNYFKEMKNIRCPVLAVYGEEDKIAPEKAVVAAHEAVSSDTKEALKAPQAGHVDQVLGKNSKPLWEQILNFFDRHLT